MTQARDRTSRQLQRQDSTNGTPKRGNPTAIARTIAAAIRRGEFPLGSQLPSERTLAAQYGISRSTVRKAIQLLAASNVLTVSAGAGRQSGSTIRSDIVPTDLLDTDRALDPDEVADVLLARRLIEPGVAQLAGTMATRDDLAALRAIIEEQAAARDSPERVRELDASFHLAIARSTHNDTVIALMHTLLERFKRVRRTPLPHEIDETLEIHTLTANAIATRDPHHIAQIMDKHLAVMERVLEAEDGRKLLAPPPPFLDAPTTAVTSSQPQKSRRSRRAT